MSAPIRLSVPGTLRYRAIAVRAVAEAARLVSGSTHIGLVMIAIVTLSVISWGFASRIPPT